ncbi:hypothetical protein CCS92_27815, partial [Methylobacterium radiotolerans]
MKGIGEEIWEAAPSAFKAVYIDLYSRLGRDFPIQIITDEPHVPWEMMHRRERDDRRVATPGAHPHTHTHQPTQRPSH